MKNTVELIGFYGGDVAIARAAWTSTQIDLDNKTDEQIGDLIDKKLWNNPSDKPHKTPFERGIVEFNITVEQASHIQTLKHRLANINGESARYMELKEDKYYLPDDWSGIEASEDIYSEVGGLLVAKGKDWRYVLNAYSQDTNRLYHAALKDLTPVLGRKRAKESARFFKTMNSQLTLSVMMNMSCFYNFQSLRNDPAAQLEIQDIAKQMLQKVSEIEGQPFKHTLKAFGLS